MFKFNERFPSTLPEHLCIILPLVDPPFFPGLELQSKYKCSLSNHFAKIFPVISWLPKLILSTFQEELTGC